MEITNLFDKDVKVKVINVLADLEKITEDLRKTSTKIQKLKNTVTEMKHIKEGMNNRLLQVEQKINGMEIREQEYKEAEEQREARISKNERMIRELYDQSKQKIIV